MICWTVTIFTDDSCAEPFIATDAVPSLTEARLTAGDTAIARLTHPAAHTDTAVFLSITIDDHTALAGGVAPGRYAAGGLTQLVNDIRQLQRAAGSEYRRR